MSKDEALRSIFDQIATLPHIESVSGDFIPSSPKIAPYEEHLFINCIYDDYSEERGLEVQLEQFRDDAAATLGIVMRNVLRDLFKSVVVSFFILPATGTNLRIYCVRVSAISLKEVNAKTLPALAEHESSNLPHIGALLEQR